MREQLSPSDLMHQARDTAETYFNQSVRVIDEKFGEGYAKEHPELIAGFMNTAARGFDTAIMNQELGDLLYQVPPILGKTAAPCGCRLQLPAPGLVRDLLQQWIVDHPVHPRKQHISAHDVLHWLERRSNGGRA